MRYGDNATVARRITNDEIATVAKNGRSRAVKAAARAARGTKSMPGTLKLDGNWPAKNPKIEAFDREMAEHGRHAQGAANLTAAQQQVADNVRHASTFTPAREPWKKTTTAALVGAGGLTVASGYTARRAMRPKKETASKGWLQDGMTLNRALTTRGQAKTVMGINARHATQSGNLARAAVGATVGHVGGGKAAEYLARNAHPATQAKVKSAGQTLGRTVGLQVGLRRSSRAAAQEVRSRGLAKGMNRQSVMPVLARVKPNRSVRRVVTGDVEKFSPTGAFESLTRGAKALSGGVKAGLAGVKPAAALPNMRDAKTLGLANQGAKVGGYAAANPGKVAGLVGTAGLTTGVVAGNRMSKADVAKHLDPEDRRRHYQGVAAGVGGSAGVAALANAGRIATRDTREFKRNLPHINPGRVPGMQDERGFKTKGRARAATAQEKLGLVMDRDTRMKQWEQLNRAKMATDKVRGKKLLHIGGRSAGYGAAGLALIGTAAASHRGRNDERWD